MAISIVNLGVSANPDINIGTDLALYSGTSWTPPTSGLLIADVFSRFAGAPPNIPSVSGNDLVFVQIATVTFGTSSNSRLTRFGANLSGSVAGISVFDFAGQVQIGCSISFYYSSGTGVDLSTGVTGAFVQSPTNSAASGITGSVVLNAAGNSNNRPIAVFSHQANEVTTPKSLWTELDDLAGSAPARGLDTQFRGDSFDTVAEATWITTSAWGAIASELKATSDVPITKNASDTESVSISEGTTNVLVLVSPTETISVSLSESVSIKITTSPSDTESISLTETSSISVTTSASDTLGASLSESSSVLVSISASDTISTSISESTTQVLVSRSLTDSIGVSLSESSSAQISSSPNDALDVSLTETTSVLVSISPTDTENVSISEASSVAISSSSSDTLSVNLTETSSISVVVIYSDALAISISESSDIVIGGGPVEVVGSDILGISLSETASVLVSFSTSDTENISLTETISISTVMDAVDTVSLSISEISGIVIMSPAVYVITSAEIVLSDHLSFTVSTDDELVYNSSINDRPLWVIR